jgi:hypothetical protein
MWCSRPSTLEPGGDSRLYDQLAAIIPNLLTIHRHCFGRPWGIDSAFVYFVNGLSIASSSLEEIR